MMDTGEGGVIGRWTEYVTKARGERLSNKERSEMLNRREGYGRRNRGGVK